MRTSILFITLIGLGYMSSVFGCGRQNGNVYNRIKGRKDVAKQARLNDRTETRLYFATMQKEQKVQQRPS